MKIKAGLILLITGLLSFSSQAIIIRHDVAPNRYTVGPSDFPSVFFLEQRGNRKVCVATVIHRQWAITAAHCTEETPLAETIGNGQRFSVQVGGRDREIDGLIIHPNYKQSPGIEVDLALVRFQNPANVPRPIPLQMDEDELGAEISLVGWGFFGLGTTGRQYDDGSLRRARNRITSANRRLRIVFDDPRELSGQAVDLEGLPGLGDSGGPALLETETGYRLAGIAIGEIEGSDFSEETQGKYGSVAIYERVTQHLDWIETAIGGKLSFDR